MLRLFNADMNRVFRSPVYWVFSVLTLILTGITLIANIQMTPSPGPVAWVYAENLAVNVIGISWLMLVGLFSLFNQDFKSRIHQAAIGNGVSRTKIVLTKYLECVAVMAVNLALMYLTVTLMRMASGIGLSGEQEMAVFNGVIYVLIHLAAVFGILMLPLFLTGNLAVSALIGCVISLNILEAMVSLLKNLVSFDLGKYMLGGNLQMLQSGFESGQFAVFPIIMIAVYTCLGIGLAVLAFRKRELEF